MFIVLIKNIMQEDGEECCDDDDDNPLAAADRVREFLETRTT